MDFLCGTIVGYDDGVTRGSGRVVGVANTGSPVIGKSYIVEQLSGEPSIPNKIYPYTHRVVFECHIIKA